MTALVLSCIAAGILALVSTYAVYRLGKWLWPPPQYDDSNPWMNYEETDPYIIKLQQEIEKARAKHKPVVPLLIKLNKARHDRLREELTQ